VACYFLLARLPLLKVLCLAGNFKFFAETWNGRLMVFPIRLVGQVNAIRQGWEGHTEIYPKLFAGETLAGEPFRICQHQKCSELPLVLRHYWLVLISGKYPMISGPFYEHTVRETPREARCNIGCDPPADWTAADQVPSSENLRAEGHGDTEYIQLQYINLCNTPNFYSRVNLHKVAFSINQICVSSILQAVVAALKCLPFS